MNAAARILVATEVVADAGLVRKLLSDEFDNVSLSTDPDNCVADFERCRPEVLILAFNTLAKAERYYLGLYRLSTLIHALPHRTVILCNKDDLRRVYALCKKEHFDDYVLFWPLTHDTPRLPMAVIHALRQLGGAGIPDARTFAAQARRVATLESRLAHYVAQGDERVAVANRSLQQAGRDIGAALDGLSRRFSEGELRELVEVKDRGGFQREFDRLRAGQIDPRLAEVAASVEPVARWIDSIDNVLAHELDAARDLQALAEQVRPLILVVDDDALQCRLLAQVLQQAGLDSLVVASGAEALAALRRHRPDLVLMDVNLPGIDGIETTRRLKSVEPFATIPVIMITGRSEKSVVVDSLKVGASDFVVKPVDRDALIAKVRAYLDAASLLTSPSATSGTRSGC